jgi:thioredoxin reductase (NADPH)
MDYTNVPITLFTPLEYGSIGLNEEDAFTKYSKENISVFHTDFKPLEWNLDKNKNNDCYVKVIVNKSDKNRVVGFHILSPCAGEVC